MVCGKGRDGHFPACPSAFMMNRDRLNNLIDSKMRELAELRSQLVMYNAEVTERSNAIPDYAEVQRHDANLDSARVVEPLSQWSSQNRNDNIKGMRDELKEYEDLVNEQKRDIQNCKRKVRSLCGVRIPIPYDLEGLMIDGEDDQ
ncbi:uncharacterized protein LOC110860557 isoform X1 [Folsomia candida]|uniref:uncharacterized protein LOC110860557 isoform X1 n=1 Tax=Folsomia candida TaxID=158441 RepID=UPI000B907A55|nr:uncharacterized protein LOC110860557 isoform X1 [Folsomia candida]